MELVLNIKVLIFIKCENIFVKERIDLENSGRFWYLLYKLIR